MERARVEKEFFMPFCEDGFGAVSMLAILKNDKPYYLVVRESHPVGDLLTWVDEEDFNLARWHGPDESEAEEQFRLEIDNIECWAVALDDSEGQL